MEDNEKPNQADIVRINKDIETLAEGWRRLAVAVAHLQASLADDESSDEMLARIERIRVPYPTDLIRSVKVEAAIQKRRKSKSPADWADEISLFELIELIRKRWQLRLKREKEAREKEERKKRSQDDPKME